MLNSNAQQWLYALRSGDYAQGRGALYDGLTHTFCCLGVACDLFTKENPTEGYWSGNDFITAGGVSRSSLPLQVADWLGMKSCIASYGSSADQNLINDNDTRHNTFAQIADIIEAHQKELFND